MSSTFIPQGYKEPSAGGAYLKMPKSGECARFAVLSNVTEGWLYWTNDNRCMRSPTQWEDTPNIRIEDGSVNSQRYFWSFLVVDLADGEVKIAEITQKTIRGDIEGLITKGGYDLLAGNVGLALSRSGAGKVDTKYQVMPIILNEVQLGMLANTKSKKESWPDLKEQFKNTPPQKTEMPVDVAGLQETM
jgi:hypothetical protein